jgi:hypothetical protein
MEFEGDGAAGGAPLTVRFHGLDHALSGWSWTSPVSGEAELLEMWEAEWESQTRLHAKLRRAEREGGWALAGVGVDRVLTRLSNQERKRFLLEVSGGAGGVRLPSMSDLGLTSPWSWWRDGTLELVAELAPGVTFDGGRIIVIGRSVPETVAAAMVGRPASGLIAHPFFDETFVVAEVCSERHLARGDWQGPGFNVFLEDRSTCLLGPRPTPAVS